MALYLLFLNKFQGVKLYQHFLVRFDCENKMWDRII